MDALWGELVDEVVCKVEKVAQGVHLA